MESSAWGWRVKSIHISSLSLALLLSVTLSRSLFSLDFVSSLSLALSLSLSLFLPLFLATSLSPSLYLLFALFLSLSLYHSCAFATLDFPDLYRHGDGHWVFPCIDWKRFCTPSEFGLQFLQRKIAMRSTFSKHTIKIVLAR